MVNGCQYCGMIACNCSDEDLIEKGWEIEDGKYICHICSLRPIKRPIGHILERRIVVIK